MSFDIRVDGQLFTFWVEASVKRSIESNCGTFSFASTNTSPAEYPVKVGSSVEVVSDDITLLTGFVDAIESSGSKSQGITITVSGRDNLADIIDSSVPDAVKHIDTPISMDNFCRKIINALGLNIKVINATGESLNFGEEVEIDAESGRKCMDFLVSFARKKQVYIVSDGLGNLVIFRPIDKVTGDKIIQTKDGVGNNIKSFSKTINNSERYNLYKVRSQDNYGADPDADEVEGVDRQGDSVDTQIRKGRYLEMQAEETMPGEETKNRAEELNNLRRAKALSYSVDIVGALQQNGNLWDFGIISLINDEFADVKGAYMVKDVDFKSSLSTGTVTTLNFARKEAYKVRGEITEQDKRVCPTEDIFTEATPPEDLQFERRQSQRKVVVDQFLERESIGTDALGIN